jgi:hypothetical protein
MLLKLKARYARIRFAWLESLPTPGPGDEMLSGFPSAMHAGKAVFMCAGFSLGFSFLEHFRRFCWLGARSPPQQARQPRPKHSVLFLASRLIRFQLPFVSMEALRLPHQRTGTTMASKAAQFAKRYMVSKLFCLQALAPFFKRGMPAQAPAQGPHHSR